ncbi:hypothetical protein S7711_05330 [Stachybotrys chartarum IBT 7711]|uniref:superoxide dismutase n=1 Tax=Stachybotrys chartarum (strain CBS 109288 / IBT 7711) TaxID=1280523 RepID=A0A084ALI2_STACB|nr:hypothetical protein S7711_05330 [Stachybotrys chartarum IBT 7711]KFA50850.1 hypothetical protein S40293_05838 [Stachybotrys chartarum IBT 40293]KFA76722.1 hypothetical protein S40288_10270 [Stachybotrys chartarum IBT 40288]
MHSLSAALPAIAALVGQALAQTAEPVTNNPVGPTYRATLPDEPFFAGAAIEGNVRGSITGQATEDGTGVEFTVEFDNLPAEGGPFGYHLHAAPVVDGNCTSALAHLDPYQRGQVAPCDAANPQTCEVGDLSGKHGSIEAGPFSATYVDNFASTLEGIGAFFGNRSIVIHYANSTRLTCANFELIADAEPSQPPMSNTTSTTASMTSTMTSTMSHSATTPGQPIGTGGMTTSAPAGPGATETPLPAAASVSQLSLPLMIAGLAAVFFAL